MYTFPNLIGSFVATDIETHEEMDIQKFGSGAHRSYLTDDPSEILCISMSDAENDFCFPASQETFNWLMSIQDKYLFVGHNILYDLGWLYYEGFKPTNVADTMGLVKMLDEDRQPRKGFPKPYSLDACGNTYLGSRKEEDKLKELCDKYSLKGAPQKHLKQLIELGHEDVVYSYAKKDTRLTYDLYKLLIPRIAEQGMAEIWSYETRLLPILVEVNNKGIRVDESRRESVSIELGKEVDKLEQWLFDKAGGPFKEGSGKQLEVIFTKLDLPFKRNPPTENMLKKDPNAIGNPSFPAEDLLPYGIDPNMEYFPHVLVSYRKLRKLKKDFIDRLQDFIIDGRIHPNINPYGAKTGRPTSNAPNIFQIPKRGRGKELCRTLFIPEEGCDWYSMDYASEEYRVFTHYAVGAGADIYRRKYNTIPGYDMHVENAQLAGVDRTKAKTIGLGVLFGMGMHKMALNLGAGEKRGLAIVKKFHEVNPSFKQTSNRVQSVAKKRGWIHTIMGRRRRFPKGEGAYRGLNFLTQGNSADLGKITIVKAHEAGLLDKMTFHLWLYDEYNFSVKPGDEHLIKQFQEIAETSIKLKVKMQLDIEKGPNWGEVKKV
jgi:DNA polymerase-1